MDSRDRKLLYQKVRRAKMKVKHLKATYKIKVQELPRDTELRRTFRKFYQQKIDIAEERLSKLMMEYYTL